MQQQILQWLNKIYSYIRIFSIDIVLGAMSISFYASHLFESSIPVIYWFLLALSVWCIYTFDHILDGAKVSKPIKNKTYRFHYQNQQKLIIIISIIALAVIILSIVYLNSYLFKFLILGGGWIGAYFFVQNLLPRKAQNYLPKELLITVGYIIGTIGIPYFTRQKELTAVELLFIVSITLLVLINVLIYSYFDYEEDKRSGFINLIQLIKLKAGHTLILSLAILSNILCIYLFILSIEILPILIISIGLSLIIVFPKKFGKNQLYGKVADVLFLLPSFYLLIHYKKFVMVIFYYHYHSLLAELIKN